MSVKTILVAHRLAPISDRFAAALADARHAFVQADAADAALAVVQNADTPISLVLLDLGLAEDGIGFVRDLRRAARQPLPIVVFSGSIAAASQVPELAALSIAGYINEHASTAQILPALAPSLSGQFQPA
jgi:DNA-binding NarL/FixJ family response regulator